MVFRIYKLVNIYTFNFFSSKIIIPKEIEIEIEIDW